MDEIHKFIISEAQNVIKEIDEKGYVSGGKNGPYDDNETPYRNSAHWIIIFSWLYKYNEIYEKYLLILAEYLYNSCDNLNYKCREKKNKDKINGTIGIAWIIEGLVKATEITKNLKYYDLAVKLFLNHPYSYKNGCWNRREIDNTLLGFDTTFNHQLWLAASGALILNVKDNFEIRKQITFFLDKCNGNKLFRIYNNGLIKHFAFVGEGFFENFKYIKHELKLFCYDTLHKPSMKYKEEGYHYFCLYAFALLKNQFGDEKIFKSKKLKKALEFATDKNNYKRQVERKPYYDITGLANKLNINSNIYSFPYNSPAFELPYILYKFDIKADISQYLNELWQIQKEEFIDQKGNKVNDYKTLVARIYELVRYFDIKNN